MWHSCLFNAIVSLSVQLQQFLNILTINLKDIYVFSISRCIIISDLLLSIDDFSQNLHCLLNIMWDMKLVQLRLWVDPLGQRISQALATRSICEIAMDPESTKRQKTGYIKKLFDWISSENFYGNVWFTVNIRNDHGRRTVTLFSQKICSAAILEWY